MDSSFLRVFVALEFALRSALTEAQRAKKESGASEVFLMLNRSAGAHAVVKNNESCPACRQMRNAGRNSEVMCGDRDF